MTKNYMDDFNTGWDAGYFNDFCCPKCCLKFSMDKPYNTKVVLECPECGHIFEVEITISYTVSEI